LKGWMITSDSVKTIGQGKVLSGFRLINAFTRRSSAKDGFKDRQSI
jgi:hypothetical protein